MKRSFYLILLFLCTCIAPQYLHAAATVQGTITDSITGLPISGALIELVKGGTVRYSGTTAPDGTYSITGIEPSNYTLVASASSYQTKTVGVRPPNNQVTTVNLALLPNGGTINGTVTDGGTTLPIMGATIRIFKGSDLIATATTNGAGFYSIPNLAADNYTVLASASGYQAQFQGATVQAGATTTANFALVPPPGTISGTVTDALTTNPIVGAIVEVFHGSVLIGFADTDINGDYTITDLSPGSCTVTASADGYQSENIGTVVVGGATTTVDFALDPDPGAISGTVIDASTGIPIPGVSINIFEGATRVASVLTDVNGEYEISILPPGNYIVSADATSYQRQIKGATVASDATTVVDFSLNLNPGSISGTVINSTTTDPIPGAAINIYREQVLVATTLSDANGDYSVSNLAPETYTVVASKTDYQTQSAAATVTSDVTTTVNFALIANPGAISGTVTNAATTNPIEGARVLVFSGQTFISSALTDTDGDYAIFNLAPGNYNVLVVAEGYQSAFSAETVLAGLTTTADFALNSNPGTIAGTVTDGCAGTPLSGVLIVVKDSSTIIGFGVTDTNGNYLIDTIPPGSYMVTTIKTHFLSESSSAVVIANTITTVNFTLTPTVLPPETIYGCTVKNKFLTQTEFIHVISWTESPSSCVTGYQVFRNAEQIAFVSSTSKLEYQDHNRNKRVDVYSVRAVNSFGLVSSAVSVTVGSKTKCQN